MSDEPSVKASLRASLPSWPILWCVLAGGWLAWASLGPWPQPAGKGRLVFMLMGCAMWISTVTYAIPRLLTQGIRLGWPQTNVNLGPLDVLAQPTKPFTWRTLLCRTLDAAVFFGCVALPTLGMDHHRWLWWQITAFDVSIVGAYLLFAALLGVFIDRWEARAV